MTIPKPRSRFAAGAIGQGGEFSSDMGEPLKILDLAEDMIRLSGLEPYEDIDIVFTAAYDRAKIFDRTRNYGRKSFENAPSEIFIGKIGTSPAGS